jgi:hypothetical protein
MDQCGFPALAQNAIASDQDFCHCCATWVQNSKGFAAVALDPGSNCSLENISGDAFIGFGDLSCSSQAFIK